MIDEKEIFNNLREIYNSGMTYQQMAKKYGISYSYLHDVMTGKRPVEGLTIKKINQLFPAAILHINGDKVDIQAPNNNGNVVGINHGSMAGTNITNIIDKVLDSEEFTAEEKIKVLKVIKN